MTDLLAQALEAAQHVSGEQQDAIARLILDLAQEGLGEERIPPEDLADVLAGLAEADGGDFASDAEVQAALQRFRA